MQYSIILITLWREPFNLVESAAWYCSLVARCLVEQFADRLITSVVEPLSVIAQQIAALTRAVDLRRRSLTHDDRRISGALRLAGHLDRIERD